MKTQSLFLAIGFGMIALQKQEWWLWCVCLYFFTFFMLLIVNKNFFQTNTYKDYIKSNMIMEGNWIIVAFAALLAFEAIGWKMLCSMLTIATVIALCRSYYIYRNVNI